MRHLEVPLNHLFWHPLGKKNLILETGPHRGFAICLCFLPPQKRPRCMFGRFKCRPSSAHVSGGLWSPFWEPFWPQKCSFLIMLFLIPWILLLSSFSIDVCYACPLKFACFGRCEKKAHMACDPQKLVDVQDVCMCAAPPATQQGRQQRTTNTIENGPTTTNKYEKNDQ